MLEEFLFAHQNIYVNPVIPFEKTCALNRRLWLLNAVSLTFLKKHQKISENLNKKIE